MPNCPVLNCKVCCKTGNGKGVIDCNEARVSTGGSPCGVCFTAAEQDGNNGRCDFAGSILVDAIAAIIFFFFWMMQFWLNIACCVFQACKHLYNADRTTQLVAGAICIVLFGSIIIHGMFGKPCCNTRVDMHNSQQSNSKSCNSKLRGGFFSSRSSSSISSSSSSGGGGDASFSASVSVDAKAKGQVHGSVSSQQSSHSQSSFKVKLKDSKLSKKAGPSEKTFHLTITDEKKKKLYETSAKFQLPAELTDKPALVLSTDPIILENY